MEGTICGYRKSHHTQHGNDMVVIVEGVKKKDAAQKLIGKKVTYNTGKKNINGKISNYHGNSGAVRVLFETGLPGQALGKKVKIE